MRANCKTCGKETNNKWFSDNPNYIKDKEKYLIDRATLKEKPKKCNKCGIEKDQVEFYRQKGGKNGKSAICKPCESVRAKTYRLDNPNYNKNYRENLPEIIDIKEGNKTCARCKIEKSNTEFWREKKRPDGLDPYCKVCHVGINQKYIDNNQAKVKLYRVKHHKINAERDRRNGKIWELKNPEKAAQKSARSRLRRRENLLNEGREEISKKSHKNFLTDLGLYDGEYFYCYVTQERLIKGTLSFDHVIPISKGGPNKKENLLPMNLKLNISKQNKFLDEWDYEGKNFTETVANYLKTLNFDSFRVDKASIEEQVK